MLESFSQEGTGSCSTAACKAPRNKVTLVSWHVTVIGFGWNWLTSNPIHMADWELAQLWNPHRSAVNKKRTHFQLISTRC